MVFQTVPAGQLTFWKEASSPSTACVTAGQTCLTCQCLGRESRTGFSSSTIRPRHCKFLSFHYLCGFGTKLEDPSLQDLVMPEVLIQQKQAVALSTDLSTCCCLFQELVPPPSTPTPDILSAPQKTVGNDWGSDTSCQAVVLGKQCLPGDMPMEYPQHILSPWHTLRKDFISTWPRACGYSPEGRGLQP